MKKSLSKILIIIIIFLVIIIGLVTIYILNSNNMNQELSNYVSLEEDLTTENPIELMDNSDVQSAVTMQLSKIMGEYNQAVVIVPGSISDGTAFFTINGEKIFMNENFLEDSLPDGKLPTGNWNISADGKVTGP